MGKLSVYLEYPPSEAELAELRTRLESGVALTLGPELPDEAAFEVLVSGRAERQELSASPTLRTVIVPWAGIPTRLRDLVLRDFPQLTVYNLHHNAAPVAEVAMALLLAAAKFVVPLDQALRDNDWTPRYEASRAMLLDGKTALVLGYGAIGRRVARGCVGLGMRVIGVRRTATGKADEWAAEVHPPEKLHALLPRAHVLMVCLPLTPQTEGLIGAHELGLLPPGAVLVNIGRGTIIEQAALFQTLQTRHLRAAGLDVWYSYPSDERSRRNTAPADFPFNELDNVVMSPHRGGSSDETGMLRMQALANLLNRLARGEPGPNRVDLKAGY